MSARTRLITAPLLAIAGLALAGCGSSNNTASQSVASVATAATATAQPAAPTDPRLTHKPVVKVPAGSAPTKLVVKDLITGSGPAAKPGDQLTVQYVGVNYKGGKQFDASWDHGQPFPFQLGAGMVIPGWDRGLVGMRVGGRRELIVPPSLGYGPQGQPPVIKPNETLVFVVDLERID
jgi:peptidylprolyl isomerase